MGIIDKFLDLEKNEKTKTDSTSKEVMTKEETKKTGTAIRTLDNVRSAAEAQRIFNPTLPPTKPKGPTEAQLGQGTAPAADMQGNWGTASGNE